MASAIPDPADPNAADPNAADPAVMHVVACAAEPSETFVAGLLAHLPRPPAAVLAFDDGVLARAGRLPPALAGRTMVAVVAAVALRRRAEVVHAHFARTAPVAVRAARAVGRPAVVALHGRDLLVEAPRHGWLPAVRAADAVTVPSSFLAERAAAAGIDPSRTHVLPSGVDLAEHPFCERAAPADGAPVVLFVGRFTEKKGATDLLAAARRLGDAVVRARFVGYGEGEAELRAMGAEILDGRSRSTVLRALDDAHLVCTPSRTALDGDAETLCVVNLEAQARGIPVLTTDHGGIPEGLGAGAAVVVPEGDLDALTDGLRQLVTSPDRWAAMGRAGRSYVETNAAWPIRAAAVAALHRQLRR